MNSRKSLFKGIGVGSLSQFEEDVGPLLRGHLRAGKGVGGIDLFEGVKNADYFRVVVSNSARNAVIRCRPPPLRRHMERLSLAASSTSGTGSAARV